MGDKQCSPVLAREGGKVNMDVTAQSGGLVNTTALNGCTISQLTISYGGSPMTRREGDATAQHSTRQKTDETQKKNSLKVTLQQTLRNKFSVIHQESGDCRIQDIYTELYIIEGRTGGVISEHEVATIDMRQIGRGPSCEDMHVDLASMFSDRTVTKVLTLGIAGVGKTVAVQKFVMDWAEGHTNQGIDFVFVLPFRELNLKKDFQCKFIDLLLSFYPGLRDLENFCEFSECKILFVFDGLDESRFQLDFDNWVCKLEEESSVDILIASLIKGALLSSAHVWITTRPAAASLIPRECFNLVTEVRGFNDPQKIEFFQKNIRNPEKARRVIDHVKNNRSLHIMCHIPVFCHIIASVLGKILEGNGKEETDKTLTELYTLYSISQIKTMNDKFLDKKMSAKKKGQFLVKLGKLAFRHLEKGTLLFYERDLKECGISVNSGALQAGICTQIFSVESAVTGENMYSFVHLSVQEFLAALYVLNRTVAHRTSPFVKTTKEKLTWLFKHSQFDLYRIAVDQALQSQSGHLDLFVRFLLGLAPMLEPKIRYPLDVVLPQLAVRKESVKKTVEYIKEKIREDLSPERIINLFHCLNELRDNSLVEEINRYINLGDEQKNLTPAQCSALAYLLLMSAKEIEEFDMKKYLRSEEGLHRMIPVVKVSRRVWLNQCHLSKASCRLLASELQRTPSHLRELDMSDNDLQDEGVELLCVGLRDPQCKLETLRLNQCHLSKASCEIMASMLQRTPSHLRELDMSDNDLQDAGVELLCVGLRDPQCRLETLRLIQCHLSKPSCEIMASVLQMKPSHLRELDVGYNCLQDKGVELLCVGLRNIQSQLETLRLNQCQLSKTSCEMMVSVLQGTPSHLRELDMGNNDLQDEGVELLCVGLRHPQCKLERLRLNHCQLSEASCEMMALVLKGTNSHLRELDMSNNDLQDEGVDLLCVGLRDPQCKLETLRLSGCLITHEGCSFLASALKSNPSYLKELDLSYNHPGDSGARELTDRLNDPKCRLDTFGYDNGGECRTTPGLRKYACELTLDPNTAHIHLALSEGNRKVTRMRAMDLLQPYPAHSERFDWSSQVLGRDGLSGRCYWEAERSGIEIMIGMAYKSIQRKGSGVGFGLNDKSWSLNCDYKYSAWHNNKETTIPAPSSRSSRVGVYLDWPAGTLSFYSVSADTRTHLHTFHSTFTEPLYPGFLVVYDCSSVSLCQIT